MASCLASFASLEGSIRSSLRMYAAIGVSVLVHAAVLFNGAPAGGPWPAAMTGELSVSLAGPDFPGTPASRARKVVAARGSEASPTAEPRAPTTAAVPAQAAGDGAAAGDADVAAGRAGRDATPAAPAAPASGAVDLFDAPRARFAPAPDYPDEARWEGREGRVLVRFRLSADGRVSEAQLAGSSGHADLDSVALAALRRWDFSPLGGATPENWYRHAFRFALR